MIVAIIVDGTDSTIIIVIPIADGKAVGAS